MLRRIEFLPAQAVEGSSPLASAPDRLRRWPERRPAARGPETGDRTALAQTLEARLTALGAHVRSLESVRALAAPDARCVVTVVRPGLLGPRLGGLWSVLACVRAAEELARRWGAPVVPLAWIRADGEADPELAQAWIPNRRHELQRVALPGAARGAGPLADEALDGATHRLPAIRALLLQLFGDAEHVEEALELLMPRGGESLGGASQRALHALLGHRGLVALDPAWLREESSRALAAWVAETPFEALQRAGERVGGGEHPLAGAALALRLDPAARRALRARGEGYRFDGEPGSRTAAELAAELVQEPLRWAPGDATLPAVLARALPVAAQVSRPAERLLHAQLAALDAESGREMPPFLPQRGATLVDEETDRALARLGRSVREALEEPPGDPGPAGERPAALVELRAIAEVAFRELAARRPDLAELEPSLAGQLSRALAQARAAIERVLGKAERLASDRSGRGKRYARRLGTLLRPFGGPQERTLGLFTFVARYDTGWIDELLAEWDPLAPEHLVAHLGAPQPPT